MCAVRALVPLCSPNCHAAVQPLPSYKHNKTENVITYAVHFGGFQQPEKYSLHRDRLINAVRNLYDSPRFFLVKKMRLKADGRAGKVALGPAGVSVVPRHKC